MSDADCTPGREPRSVAASLGPVTIRVRMIVQKTDSPIVDSIGQNYRAIAEL